MSARLKYSCTAHPYYESTSNQKACLSPGTILPATMELDGVPDINNRVNYEEVGALSQKRIIAFFNEFVGQTVTFLNKFSSECEEKLFIVDTRLEKLETMLSILEAKLSSVPELTAFQNTHSSTVNGETTSDTATAQPENRAAASTTGSQPAAAPNDDRSALPQPESDQAATSVSGVDRSEAGLVCLRQTEPYRRFFRMLEVGVPEPAVRMKMQQEGLDPDALQRGGELVPDPAAAAGKRGSDSEQSDAASWDSKSS